MMMTSLSSRNSFCFVSASISSRTIVLNPGSKDQISSNVVLSSFEFIVTRAIWSSVRADFINIRDENHRKCTAKLASLLLKLLNVVFCLSGMIKNM